MTLNRRAEDLEIERRLTSLEEGRKAQERQHEENQDRLKLIDAKMELMLQAVHMAEGGWWAAGKIIAVILGAGSGFAMIGSAAWWAFQHVAIRPAIVLTILLASAALAHEDDQFLRELQTPTGGSCCSDRDCSLTDDWDQRAGAYRVRVEGEWREVPAEIVIRGKPPHPSGRAVLCVLPAGQPLCFLPGATGV